MFQFMPLSSLPYEFRQRCQKYVLAGYPIRTPSDQSLVGSSPRLSAASHFLHRLLIPVASTKSPFQLPTNLSLLLDEFSLYFQGYLLTFQRSHIFFINYFRQNLTTERNNLRVRTHICTPIIDDRNHQGI